MCGFCFQHDIILYMKKASLIILCLIIAIGLFLFLKPKQQIGNGPGIDGKRHIQKHCIGIIYAEKGSLNAPDAGSRIYCRGLTYGQSGTF